MKELFEIQQSLKVNKAQWNDFASFNYRSAEDILQQLKPLLKKHKCFLTISDEVKSVAETVFIESTITLTAERTGNKKESVTIKSVAGVEKLKGMNLAQSFGSSSSYCHKYGLGAMFLLDDGQDADSPSTARATETPKEQTKSQTASQKEAEAIQKAKIVLSEFSEAKYLDKNKAGVRDELVSDLKLKKSVATKLVIGRIDELTKGVN